MVKVVVFLAFSIFRDKYTLFNHQKVNLYKSSVFKKNHLFHHMLLLTDCKDEYQGLHYRAEQGVFHRYTVYQLRGHREEGQGDVLFNNRMKNLLCDCH